MARIPSAYTACVSGRSLCGAAALAELEKGCFEQLLRLLRRPALLHVREVRLVRFVLQQNRRVLPIPTSGKPGGRRIDLFGNVLFNDVCREIADRFVAEGVPV